MTQQLINLNKENLENEHICCAFSNKKTEVGYQLKKEWLGAAFKHKYQFIKLDERAKVFIEFGPAENAWQPITAPNYLVLGCFWVSGKYKGQGYAKALLQRAITYAKQENKWGITAVAGVNKLHFMMDGKWLLKQGFEIAEVLESGFALYVLYLNKGTTLPHFNDSVHKTTKIEPEGLTVFYSHRCPFTDYYINQELVATTKLHDIKLTIHRFNSMKEAQESPTPATIFTLYYNKKLITTDLSVCLPKNFSKLMLDKER